MNEYDSKRTGRDYFCILICDVNKSRPCEQDQTISGLKRKNQDLEKLKFVLEFQLNDLKDQTDLIQQEKVTTRERTHQV